jgi:hypothetical protein
MTIYLPIKIEPGCEMPEDGKMTAFVRHDGSIFSSHYTIHRPIYIYHKICVAWLKPVDAEIILVKGEKVCNCPSCGEEIIFGLSDELSDKIKNSPLFNKH